MDGNIFGLILDLQAGTYRASEAGANSALWKGSFEDNFRKFTE
jgi:hypothetical protein